MILVFIVAVIAFVISLVVFRKSSIDKTGRVIVSAMFAVIIGVLTTIVMSVLGTIFVEPYTVQTNTPIVLMADGSATSGRISLFRGTIQTDEVYRYYQRVGNGGLKLHSQYASVSTIFEDADEPYIITACLQKPTGWWWLNETNGPYDCTFEFHVPEGSVSNQTVLDAN